MPNVSMEKELVAVVAKPFIDQMNKMQDEGITIDEAIAGSLYAIGSALKQRGALINCDGTLRDVLQPLVMGYEEKA